MTRPLLAIACALCLSACRAKSPPVEPVPPLESVIAQALPSVVLLVRYQADGVIGFGTGLLVDDRGLVLTNLHVIDHGVSVSALLHDPERRTYTVLEGGLKRFLFEQQDHLVPAKEVRRDPALDLALVRLATSTKDRPRLPISTRTLKLGEPVVAVGHPGEMLWSFTTGVVSALPDRMIQHDALVSPGSSGGPLLDRRGEVVGIDTAMVKAPRGAGFARPAALVRGFLDEDAPEAEVDLSTPERATETCLRALERHIDACGYTGTEPTVNIDIGPDSKLPGLERLSAWRGVPLGMLLSAAASNWIDLGGEPLPSIVRCAHSDGLCSAPPSVLTPEAQQAVRAAIAALSTKDRAQLLDAARGKLSAAEAKLRARARALQDSTGFPSWRPAELRERLRGGFRIGKVQLGKDKDGHQTAWILVEGRTAKDQRYVFSVFRKLVDERNMTISATDAGVKLIINSPPTSGWVEQGLDGEQASERPKGWPLPCSDDETNGVELDAVLSRTVLDLSGEPTSTHK